MPVREARFPIKKAGVIASLAVALAFVCSPAYAWDAVKSSNGLVMVRESTDTTASTDIRIFYGYKGGDQWSASYPVTSWTSYASSTVFTNFLPPEVDAIEIPLLPNGGRFQLVSSAGAGVLVPVIYEPLRVDVTNTSLPVSGSVNTTITNDVPVTLDTTLPVSLDSTLPVAVNAIGAFDGGGLTLAIGAGLVGLGGVLWRKSA